MGMKPRLTPYQRRALPALDESIEHWRRLARGKPRPGEDAWGDDCACCEEFLYPYRNGYCTECPIAIRTGQPSCRAGPWEAAMSEWQCRYNPNTPTTARQRMVDYLVETRELVSLGKVRP